MSAFDVLRTYLEHRALITPSPPTPGCPTGVFSGDPAVDRIAGFRPPAVVWTLVIGLVSGWALSLPFQIQVREKSLSGLEWEERTLGAGEPEVVRGQANAALPLRMVDGGGVGIPADTAAWGTTYSHATHAFDHLVLPRAPWLDGEGAARIHADWTAYVGRMAEMGNNAVVLDAFLETINFDKVGTGLEIYPDTAPLRARHLAYRSLYDGLAREAEAVGMDTYLKTDLPVVTPDLDRHFRERLSGAGPGDARFWEVYALAFEELFEAMPTDRKFNGPFVARSELRRGTGLQGRAGETRRRRPVRAARYGGGAARGQ